MKKKICLFLILTIFAGIYAYSEVEFNKELFEKLSGGTNKVPSIQVPDFTRVELDNGMVVLLSVDNQYPVVEISGFIRGGLSQEQAQNAGITDMMLGMMLTGTQEMDEEQYARYKGLHGLSFDMRTERDYIYISGNSLADDYDHLINLMSQTLLKPDFDGPYYDRLMQTYQNSLMQAKTQDQSLLDSYFYPLVFPDHPYSFEKDIDLLLKTRDNLTRENLKSCYQDSILPNLTAIAVCGDFVPEEMIMLLEKHFNAWEAIEKELKKPVPGENSNYGKVVIVNKPDATGARIKMGYDFFDSSFSDDTKFSFANRVYGGGGFSSRLVDNLRTEKGYVYSVYSFAGHNLFAGEYVVSTQVKSENVLHSVEIIKEEMERIKSGDRPITEGELFDEVNRLNGTFPKYYVNMSNLLFYILFNKEFMGRSDNYINEYISEYNSLNEDIAQKVFNEYTYPDRFITVIVGNKDIILPQFTEKGIAAEIIELD